MSLRRSSYVAPTRSLWSKISGTRGRPPPIIFAQLVRPMDALQLCRWQFSHKKLCSKLSSSEVHFLIEIGGFAFLRPPLGDLGATYDDRLRLIGKRVVDFLLALIELFSLGVTAEELRAIIGWKSAISLQWGSIHCTKLYVLQLLLQTCLLQVSAMHSILFAGRSKL